MRIMTRTVKVLDRVPDTAVTFTVDTEPGEAPAAFVTIALADWDDLGQPDQLTVTIEPGDRLNDGEHL